MTRKILHETDPWLISDTHIGHKNIVEYQGRPVDHEDLIFHNWSTLVRPEDTIIHLGDVAFGSKSNLLKFSNMPGKKILILGNHDYRYTLAKFREAGFWDICDQAQIKFGDTVFHLTHYPQKQEDIWGDINIHGHIHNQHSRHPYHINVSVEVLDYCPIRLSQVYENLKEFNLIP